MGKYCLLFLVLVISSCASQKQKSIYYGGVFVADTLIKDRNQDFDSVFPILALRIDTMKRDTLYIKYRLGREALMDIDVVYNTNCNCYISLIKASFAPRGAKREFISLYILSEDKIKITFTEDGSVKEYFYSLSYIDKVNLKTHRNVYYAEQGFLLFKE